MPDADARHAVAARRGGGVIEVSVGGVVRATCGVSRAAHGRGRLAACEVVLGPWRAADDATIDAAVVRAAIRVVVTDPEPWHYIKVQDAGTAGVAADAAWRYALSLGVPCDVSEAPHGPVVTLWSTDVKGRIRRAMAALEPPAYVAERPVEQDHGAGTRYLVMDTQTSTGDPAVITDLSVEAMYDDVTARRAYQWAANVHDVEKAMRRGDRLLVAADEHGEPMYFTWASSDEAFITSLIPASVVVPPFLYIYGGYTFPRARRRGWYTRGLRAIGALERDRFPYVVARASTNNAASVNGLLKAGFVDKTP